MSEKVVDIEVSAAEIAEEIRQAAQQSITEEDLRIRVEHLLRDSVFDPLKIPWARYERTTLVRGLRSDALYGHVILEYEAPGAFQTRKGFEKSLKQLEKYIADNARFVSSYHRYFGVALDGFSMGFVRYSQRLKDWVVSEKPVVVTRYSVLKLLEAIRGLARKVLDADLLIRDLGPGSRVAKDAVSAFYRKIVAAKTERAKMLFNDWRRVFSQVCAYSPEKIKGLEQVYGIREKDINYEALLFAVHSYYALVMKLLAAEVAVLFGGYFLKSYTKKLEGAYLKSPEALYSELKNLEEGGIFIDLGIENFLEADYFAWYLDEWDVNVANVVIDVVKKLSEYEPATAELEPDVIRDLFKKLYQNLVPKKIRHDLGEYYTPDWLAELLLNEVGFSFENFEEIGQKNGLEAPLKLRLLDPACGSGTFLVLAIKRIKEYAEERFLNEHALPKIVENIVGFDLNPLAVMASRTNYLLALGELIRHATQPVELPVYFADSILAEKRSTFAGVEYVLKTAVGEFSIPTSIIDKGLLSKALNVIEECIRFSCSVSELKTRLSRELKILEPSEISSLVSLYRRILKLHDQNKNRIWTRVLKNSFAPLFKGRFDLVVGNPPWVNWENRIVDYRDYRDTTSRIWDQYGLRVAPSAQQVGLGKRGRDLSMLFTYACSDRYLMNSGLLGFLITNMVFKTGSAAGFRRFGLPAGDLTFKVVKVHDMVTIKPFEGASNMTSAIVMKRNSITEYPVPYIHWTKKKKGRIGDISLHEALERCSCEELIAVPVDEKDLTSPWLTVKPENLPIVRKIQGKPSYKAHAGEYTGGANGVYWIEIHQKLHSGLLFIENLYDVGKKKINRISTSVEPSLVRKLIRSGDVARWSWKSKCYAIVPHTVQTSWRAIKESKMKTVFPQTYSYFLNFKGLLSKRPDYLLRRKKHPFYIIFNTHKHSFATYKVAWKRIASKIEATVVGSVKDPLIGNKTPVLQETISYIPSNDESEAHYLCALLNSREVNLLLTSFSQVGGKSFATPSVLEQIRIPKFDSKNGTHRKLEELSKKAHKLVAKGDIKELSKVENQIDKLVARIYGLTSLSFD